MNTFPESFLRLPVQSHLPEIGEALRDGHVILSTPTGSGKTTCVPLQLRQLPWLDGQKILMLEPRRIAARAAAARMSALLGEPIGQSVGFRTRFESKISAETVIEVVTEGILIRQLQNDPELRGVGLVIFDEFHERSLQADLGLALCLDLCQLREELRLLIMSATIDIDAVSRLLGNGRVIKGDGKSYPVIIHHLPAINKQASLARQVVRGIHHAWQEGDGDILAFLPGAAEIRRCQVLLEELLPGSLILPLYGNLSFSEQDRVFQKATSQRRIILATPIAETSITIENISSVVDSGYFRRPVYDNTSGLSRLATHRISRASADQRAGRAGRLGPGTCYRLWSKDADHGLLAHTPPEILNADLAPLVLELASWGVSDPRQLCWLDVPRPSSWNSAVSLLQRLNLLGDRLQITDLGRRAAALPLHPRLGHMLIAGEQRGFSWTACLLAACLVDRDPCKGISSADISERIKLLENHNNQKTQKTAKSDRQLCQRLLQLAEQWYRLLAGNKQKKVNYLELGNLLLYAYPDRIALLREGSHHRYRLANGRGAELFPGDYQAGSKMLVTPQIDARQGDGKIFLAAPISIAELQGHHCQLIQEVDEVSWDGTNQKVSCSRELKVDRLVIESKPLTKVDPEKITEVFLTGLRQTGPNCLPWTRDARELQARIGSLCYWQPGQWPDFSDETMLANLEWLEPYCQKMSRLEQLKKLNLKTILLSILPWNQQQKLDLLAPSHLQVPSGSRIRLSYTPGKSPILAVRIQELFGLKETPRLCLEQIPVTLHLLSPANRPVQITSDLHSFWQNSYPEIKKELAGRYPKHYWPNDPFSAVATTRTKKGMNARRK